MYMCQHNQESMIDNGNPLTVSSHSIQSVSNQQLNNTHLSIILMLQPKNLYFSFYHQFLSGSSTSDFGWGPLETSKIYSTGLRSEKHRMHSVSGMHKINVTWCIIEHGRMGTTPHSAAYDPQDANCYWSSVAVGLMFFLLPLVPQLLVVTCRDRPKCVLKLLSSAHLLMYVPIRSFCALTCTSSTLSRPCVSTKMLSVKLSIRYLILIRNLYSALRCTTSKWWMEQKQESSGEIHWNSIHQHEIYLDQMLAYTKARL